MRIESMQWFLTVAKTGSISQAADELYITKQGLSRSLQRLEEALNAQLLYRHGKRLQLTAAGSVFLKYAEQITTKYDVMKDAISNISPNEASFQKEDLTIYVTPIISHTFLPKILSIFQKRFGDHPLNIIEMGAEELLNNIPLGRNCIGIIQAPKYLIENSTLLQKGSVNIQDFFVSPLEIACSTTSPIAEKDLITINDLVLLPLSLYGLERNLARTLLSNPNAPHVVFNSANLLLCRDRISKSDAVGFSNFIVEKYVHGPRLATIPFEIQIDMHTAYLYDTLTPLNPVLLELICILHAEFEQISLPNNTIL